MKVILKTKNGTYSATGEYDNASNRLKVDAGSIVSDSISYSEKFKGAKTIERLRAQYVSDRKVKEDVLFKSPSTAANFITGRSTNGFIAWRSEDGRTLKDIFSPYDA